MIIFHRQARRIAPLGWIVWLRGSRPVMSAKDAKCMALSRRSLHCTELVRFHFRRMIASSSIDFQSDDILFLFSFSACNEMVCVPSMTVNDHCHTLPWSMLLSYSYRCIISSIPGSTASVESACCGTMTRVRESYQSTAFKFKPILHLVYSLQACSFRVVAATPIYA